MSTYSNVDLRRTGETDDIIDDGQWSGLAEQVSEPRRVPEIRVDDGTISALPLSYRPVAGRAGFEPATSRFTVEVTGICAPGTRNVNLGCPRPPAKRIAVAKVGL